MNKNNFLSKIALLLGISFAQPLVAMDGGDSDTKALAEYTGCFDEALRLDWLRYLGCPADGSVVGTDDAVGTHVLLNAGDGLGDDGGSGEDSNALFWVRRIEKLTYQETQWHNYLCNVENLCKEAFGKAEYANVAYLTDVFSCARHKLEILRSQKGTALRNYQQACAMFDHYQEAAVAAGDLPVADEDAGGGSGSEGTNDGRRSSGSKRQRRE